MSSAIGNRRRLLLGFLRAIQSLKIAGCRMVYRDGSLVTGKELPGNFDACWDHTGVELTRLDPILLIHKETGVAKGIIAIDLERLQP